MSTFIIGSRINPIFPDVKPSSIIGINGAIELIEKKYSDFNNVTMVCSPHIFLNDFNKLKNLYKDQDIDINYFNDYIEAKKAGVNFIAYRCLLNSKEIKIEKKIKILDD